MAQQNSMRPQIPAGIERSPQFAAARSITQEGLPAAFKQLLEDEITFKAMELLDGSANEQAIGELPSPDSVRTQTREGLMSMLGSIGPGIQQQGSQMARAQQQGSQMAMAQQSGGLQSQPTPNMAQQFASGGIIGFSKGGMKKDRVKTKAYRPQSAIPVGNSSQPIPMLMQKYGTETVTQFIAEQRALDAKARALAEAGPAAGSMQIEDHKLMKEIFSEKYRDILNESMGMAGGGIVGFQDGGRIKRFQGLEGSEVPEARFGGGYMPNVMAAVRKISPLAADPTVGMKLAVDLVSYLTEQGIDATTLGVEQLVRIGTDLNREGINLGQTSREADAYNQQVREIVASKTGQTSRDADAYNQEIIAAQNAAQNAAVPKVQAVPSNPMSAEEVAASRARAGLDSGQAAPTTSSFGEGLRGLLGLTDAKTATLSVPENDAQPRLERVSMQDVMTDPENNFSVGALYPDNLRPASLREAGGEMWDALQAGQSKAMGNMGGIDSFAEGLGVDLDELGRAMYPRSTRYGEVAAETGVQAPFLKRFGASIRDVSGIPKRAAQGLYGLAEEPITQFGTGLLEEVDDIGKEVAQTDADVVANIVSDAPPVEAPASTTNRAQLLPSDQAEVTAANLVNAENGMPAIDSFDSEVTTTGAGTADSAGLGTFLADSVAGNISTASAGYQAKLDAAIARQDDPLQAISTFLRAMGEGDTIGEGMQLAGKALDSLRRSNDAEQIALLQLLETGRISEQDFQLKRLQIQNEKDQIEAFRDRTAATYEASIAGTLQRMDASLRAAYNDTFNDVATAEAMSMQLMNEAAMFTARQMDAYKDKPPSGRQLNKLMKGPAFEAAVIKKTNQLMQEATDKRMDDAGTYSQSRRGQQ